MRLENLFKRDDCDQIIEEIFSLSKEEKCKIIYPEDVTDREKI